MLGPTRWVMSLHGKFFNIYKGLNRYILQYSCCFITLLNMYVIIGFAFYYRINWSFWSGFIHLTFVGLTHCGPGPASGRSPLQLKLNHKVELLCFADKTIIQTDSLHFIKISLTIFLHEFWFCSDLFYLSEKPLIYSCMLVHCTPAAAATPTNTWSLTVTTPLLIRLN